MALPVTWDSVGRFWPIISGIMQFFSIRRRERDQNKGRNKTKGGVFKSMHVLLQSFCCAWQFCSAAGGLSMIFQLFHNGFTCESNTEKRTTIAKFDMIEPAGTVVTISLFRTEGREQCNLHVKYDTKINTYLWREGVGDVSGRGPSPEMGIRESCHCYSCRCWFNVSDYCEKAP